MGLEDKKRRERIRLGCWGWRWSSVVECLSSTCKALGPTPSARKRWGLVVSAVV